MPSSPAAQVGKRMSQLSRQVKNADKIAPKSAALAAKTIHLAELRAATGGDLIMSGVGKSGAKVGVRYDNSTAVAGSVLVRATGPVHLLERPSAAHTIIPHSIGRAKGRTKAARYQAKQDLYNALFGGGGFAGAKPLRMPWGPRFSAQHPGVQNPARAWSKGFERAKPVVTKIIERRYADAWARGIRA